MVSEEECIFCKIVRGEMSSKKVYEDGDMIAFLDINPANTGHCLVVPKKHTEMIYDTDDEVLAKMMALAKRIATKIKDELNADGVNIVQNNGQHAGQLVAHIHLHVIPRFPEDKVIITYQRTQADETALNDTQQKLKVTETIELRTEPEPEPEPEKSELDKFKEDKKKKDKDWEMDF